MARNKVVIGRPNESRIVSFRFKNSLLRHIDRTARQNQKTRNEFVAGILQQYLNAKTPV